MIFGLHWQDLFFTIGNVGLGWSLGPMVAKKVSVPFKSSVIATGCMILILIANGSLGFWLAEIACLAAAVGWSALFVQEALRRVEPKPEAHHACPHGFVDEHGSWDECPVCSH